MAKQRKFGLSVDLSDQVAIVTGASRGLGKAVAIHLAGNGAMVACIARDTEKLDETVSQIVQTDGRAQAFACDVKDRESVGKLVEEIVEKWERLDILVNNAGVTRDTLLPGMSNEEWDDVILTNLTGAFLFFSYICRPAYLSGKSMEPTYKTGTMNFWMP